MGFQIPLNSLKPICIPIVNYFFKAKYFTMRDSNTIDFVSKQRSPQISNRKNISSKMFLSHLQLQEDPSDECSDALSIPDIHH